jgi:hypothetical protein
MKLEVSAFIPLFHIEAWEEVGDGFYYIEGGFGGWVGRVRRQYSWQFDLLNAKCSGTLKQ